jgi:serine/threonine protein kinase
MSSQLQTPPKNGNLLGSGSYGKVYMVNNLAKKVMDYKYDDGILHDKNLNEVAFLSTYRNVPFIPKFNSVKIKDSKIEMLMEYCGINLEKYAMSIPYIERIKMIPSLMSQFGKMLWWMSNQNIAHVDIKPTNICIDKNGNIKLIDWGFVTYLSKQYNRNIYGTNYFADPQTLVSGSLTKNYDIYSVGMTLCWFLTKSYQYDDFNNTINSLKCKMLKEEIHYENINTFLGDYVKESMYKNIKKGDLYYELICRMINIDNKKRITPEELCNKIGIYETFIGDYEHKISRSLSIQTCITHDMIAVLVEWLIKIKIEYKLYSSLDYSIELLYRVLELQKININELQLLGICCLLISSFINTNDIIDINEVKCICKDIYTITQIENAIENIYTLLDFQVYPTYTLEGLTDNLEYDKWYNLYLTNVNGKLTMRTYTFDILCRFNEMCNLNILDKTHSINSKECVKNKKILISIKNQSERKVKVIRTIQKLLSLIQQNKSYDSILKLTINIFKFIIKHKDFLKDRKEFERIKIILREKYYGAIDSVKINQIRGKKHKKSKSNVYYYNKLVELENNINF